jgi:hypothetical protein
MDLRDIIIFSTFPTFWETVTGDSHVSFDYIFGNFLFFRVEPLFLRVSIYNRDGHLQS